MLKCSQSSNTIIFPKKSSPKAGQIFAFHGTFLHFWSEATNTVESHRFHSLLCQSWIYTSFLPYLHAPNPPTQSCNTKKLLLKLVKFLHLMALFCISGLRWETRLNQTHFIVCFVKMELTYAFSYDHMVTIFQHNHASQNGWSKSWSNFCISWHVFAFLV
jgi:hypothetical protein